MRTTHHIRAEYPLAGTDVGLPVEIRFTFEPIRGLEPSIDFGSAMPLCVEALPLLLRLAINAWARDWLDDDDGHGRAWDAALDDIERQRESARDMGMVRS